MGLAKNFILFFRKRVLAIINSGRLTPRCCQMRGTEPGSDFLPPRAGERVCSELLVIFKDIERDRAIKNGHEWL